MKTTLGRAGGSAAHALATGHRARTAVRASRGRVVTRGRKTPCIARPSHEWGSGASSNPLVGQASSLPPSWEAESLPHERRTDVPIASSVRSARRHLPGRAPGGRDVALVPLVPGGLQFLDLVGVGGAQVLRLTDIVLQ